MPRVSGRDSDPAAAAEMNQACRGEEFAAGGAKGPKGKSGRSKGKGRAGGSSASSGAIEPGATPAPFDEKIGKKAAARLKEFAPQVGLVVSAAYKKFVSSDEEGAKMDWAGLQAQTDGKSATTSGADAFKFIYDEVASGTGGKSLLMKFGMQFPDLS